MHPAFASVFLRECPRVCGWRLKPLQLGHVALLDAVGSPFMSGEPASYADVVAAAWACSRNATDAMRGRRRWWNVPAMGEGLEHHENMLREYFAHHLQAPSRWPSKDAKPCRVPWQFGMANRLCAGDWSKIDEAWNTPILEATARIFTEDAANGDETIKTEDDELGIIRARRELTKHV